MFYGVIDWEKMFGKDDAKINDSVAVFDTIDGLNWWLNHGDYIDSQLPTDDVLLRRKVDYDEAYEITSGMIDLPDTYKEDPIFPERFKWCY